MNFISPRPLLITYMFIDIFSATTRSAIFLEKMETQLDYLDPTPSEEEIISNGNPVTRLLLQAIVRTTLLRISQRGTTCRALQQGFVSILQELEDFDTLSWANKVAMYGWAHPQRSSDCASTACLLGWSALAACYKSAALLYLLLSCNASPGYSESTASKVFSTKLMLSRYIKLLFDSRNTDPGSPIESQLWRFLGWPMMVSVYVRMGWGLGEESVGEEIERLRTFAQGTSRASLLRSSSFPNSVLIRRSEDLDRKWVWDDGLDSNFFYF